MKYDLVIGSGISGLTMALLLAKRGSNVVLVESMPTIGGYLGRFSRNGLRFDTGFHFTGGFEGIMPQMLEALGLENDVRRVAMPTDIAIAGKNEHLHLPATGLDDWVQVLCDAYPNSAAAIKKYFDAEVEVIKQTPIFDLRNLPGLDFFSQMTAYDAISVDELMVQCGIPEGELRCILPIMSLCHGTPPCEAPFSYHARCAYSLEAYMSGVDGGGDAFIAGFKRELAKYGARIVTSTHISEMHFDDVSAKCHEVLLSNGESVQVERVFFAVHPSAYMELFPENMVHPRVRRRYKALKPTCSFFTLYGMFEDDFQTPSNLMFYLNGIDINSMLLPGGKCNSTGMVTSNDATNGRPTFTAFRTMFLDDALMEIGPFDEPRRKSSAYQHFKQEMTERILQDVYKAHPDYQGKLKIIDSGTPLTCKHYSAPIGSAYGTRQILAQSRIAGALPSPNCYALGHHSNFPGILGCMMCTFALAEQI